MIERGQAVAALSDRSETWDMIVVGGGATGLGVALDAVSRGLRTALIEAHDFAKGTSSRSTKLIHGGVRYLQQGQVGMVRESLLERKRLLHNAPHLVHPLEFVIPTYNAFDRYYYLAGLKAYDWLAGSSEFRPVRLADRDAVLEAVPTLRAQNSAHSKVGDLRGGVFYSDGQFDDARLALALAHSISDHGGVLANYAELVGLTFEHPTLKTAHIRDVESGEEFSLRAKVVVNATGVFSQSVMGLEKSAAGEKRPPSIVPSRGSHLVLDREFLPGTTAVLIPKTDDGRVLFAIPWLGQTLIGTTDVVSEKIELEPQPTADEVAYLLDHAGRYLSKTPVQADVRSAFSGLRPLVGSGDASQKSSTLSREHEIHVSGHGVISIVGGKWTTYRKMGEDVCDLALQVARLPKRPSRTSDLRLHGVPLEDDSRDEAKRPTKMIESSDPLCGFGSDAASIRELETQVSSASLAPYTTATSAHIPSAALVAWVAQNEMARTVEDVLSRRTRLLLCDAQAALELAKPTAQVMAKVLGRDAAWCEQQTRAFSELAVGYLPRSK